MTIDQPEHFPLQDQALPDLEHKIQVAAETAAKRRTDRNREQSLGQRAQNLFTLMRATTGPPRKSRAKSQATAERQPSITQLATAQPSASGQHSWLDRLLNTVAEAYNGDNNTVNDNELALRDFCDQLRKELPTTDEALPSQHNPLYGRIEAIFHQVCRDLEYTRFIHTVDTSTDIHKEVESPPTLLVHHLVIS